MSLGMNDCLRYLAHMPKMVTVAKPIYCEKPYNLVFLCNQKVNILVALCLSLFVQMMLIG